MNEHAPTSTPERKLKLGDIVRLKSGGPDMSVDYLYDDGKAGCVWFVSGQRNWAKFPPEVLILVKYE